MLLNYNYNRFHENAKDHPLRIDDHEGEMATGIDDSYDLKNI